MENDSHGRATLPLECQEVRSSRDRPFVCSKCDKLRKDSKGERLLNEFSYSSIWLLCIPQFLGTRLLNCNSPSLHHDAPRRKCFSVSFIAFSLACYKLLVHWRSLHRRFSSESLTPSCAALWLCRFGSSYIRRP